MTRAFKKNTEVWSAKRPLRVGLFTVFILFGGFFSWAAFTVISGAIITKGHLEVEQYRYTIQHLTGGSIEKILVKEGDIVKANDVLLKLNGQAQRHELSILEGQLFELMARRARLSAERDESDIIHFDAQLLQVSTTDKTVSELITGQRNLFQARKKNLENQVAQIKKRRQQIHTQIDGLSAQQHAISEQLRLISKELEGQEKLFKQGLNRSGTVLALQRKHASLSGQMGELSASIARAHVQLSDIELEILRLASTRREQAISQLRDLRYQETSLTEKRNELLRIIDNLDVRAPISGTVYAMSVHNEQSIVQAAEPLLYLIPTNRPMLIRTRISPNDIDQITTGQKVIIRFSSLDHRNPPEVSAAITLISADIYKDQATGASFYRVDIEFKNNNITGFDNQIPLLPGMPVEVFIQTHDRSPLTYLLNPVAQYFNRALRS